MISLDFIKYLAVMALVTYLIRMIPLIAVKKKITNVFIVSFLHYIPPAVLTVMTVPAMFHTTSIIQTITAFFVAVALAYFNKPLVVVAALACVGFFVADVGLMLC